MLDLYSQQNPGVTFESSPSAWDGYFERLSTQAAGGMMPDIIQMDYLYISTYANNGTLADLKPYMDSGALDVSSFDTNLLNSGNINGIMAGVPISSTVLTFGFNPVVLEEAGLQPPTSDWTWEDYIAMCNQVQANTGKFGMATVFRDINGLIYWVRQKGATMFNADDTALGFTDPAVISGYFDMWKGLVDNGAMPNPDEYTQIQSLDLAAQPVPVNEAAFASNWNNYGVIVSPTNENIGLMTPPLMEGGELGLWIKPGMFFSVAENSPNKDAAVKFIDWFLNDNSANDIIMAERGVPASGKTNEYLKDKLNPTQAAMIDYVTNASALAGITPPPDAQGTSEIVTLHNNLVDQVNYGQLTGQEAAEQFIAEANAILARNAA